MTENEYKIRIHELKERNRKLLRTLNTCKDLFQLVGLNIDQEEYSKAKVRTNQGYDTCLNNLD